MQKQYRITVTFIFYLLQFIFDAFPCLFSYLFFAFLYALPFAFAPS